MFAPQPVVIQLSDDIDISRGDTIVKADNLPKVGNEIEVLLCWLDENHCKQAINIIYSTIAGWSGQ